MTGDPARDELAAAQRALVQMLLGRTSIPSPFDASRLQAAALALSQKRAHNVGKTWPALVRALGAQFLERFADYASATSVPAHGGPLADGRAFARYLKARSELPEEGRLEALAVDLRYAAVREGLVPRRLPAVRIGWLRERWGLVVAVRVPWLGEYWWMPGRKR